RLVHPGAPDRYGTGQETDGQAQEDPARHHPAEHRPVQGEAVLPLRRVLAGRCHHRADPVAPAALRDRPAAAGAADREVRAAGIRAPGLPRGAVRARAGDAPLVAMSKVLPKRPYLLRAMHQWITECGHTPHVIVDAGRDGADVPRAYVKDGKIV